jgi:23S rRNA pseudouridine1911/1915/1917 synthase
MSNGASFTHSPRDLGREPEQPEVPSVFVAGAGHPDQRLDVFLAARLACSRADAQRSIEQGAVINGRPARSSHKVHAGDRVEVTLPETTADDEPTVLAAAPEDIPLTVLFEDEEIIVIDKPAGMVVHPAGDITHGTLANALTHRWGHEPGLVHRLDRDTSGVMVVARSTSARERLTEQFRLHTVTKEYLALVHGRPAAGGRIDVPLRRDRKNRLRIVTCPPGEGRDALTLYRVRQAWSEVALLDVEIKTGRTHQIRVHCAHLGHPVVADEMYGKGRTAHLHAASHRAAVAALGRQFLHAARLSFDHPTTGERLTFRSPLAPDLQALLAALDVP